MQAREATKGEETSKANDENGYSFEDHAATIKKESDDEKEEYEIEDYNSDEETIETASETPATHNDEESIGDTSGREAHEENEQTGVSQAELSELPELYSSSDEDEGEKEDTGLQSPTDAGDTTIGDEVSPFLEEKFEPLPPPSFPPPQPPLGIEEQHAEERKDEQEGGQYPFPDPTEQAVAGIENITSEGADSHFPEEKLEPLPSFIPATHSETEQHKEIGNTSSQQVYERNKTTGVSPAELKELHQLYYGSDEEDKVEEIETVKVPPLRAGFKAESLRRRSQIFVEDPSSADENPYFSGEEDATPLEKFYQNDDEERLLTRSSVSTVDLCLGELKNYISDMKKVRDVNAKPFVDALDNLYAVLEDDILAQVESGVKTQSILNNSAASHIADKTVDMLKDLTRIPNSLDKRTLQTQTLQTYKKECEQSSCTRAVSKAFLAVFVTGFCMILGGALGFAAGAAVGSVAGPAGSVAVGSYTAAKGAAIGAGVGTAIGTTVGLGTSFRYTCGLFQRNKKLEKVEEVVREGRRYIAGN